MRLSAERMINLEFQEIIHHRQNNQIKILRNPKTQIAIFTTSMKKCLELGKNALVQNKQLKQKDKTLS